MVIMVYCSALETLFVLYLTEESPTCMYSSASLVRSSLLKQKRGKTGYSFCFIPNSIECALVLQNLKKTPGFLKAFGTHLDMR